MDRRPSDCVEGQGFGGWTDREVLPRVLGVDVLLVQGQHLPRHTHHTYDTKVSLGLICGRLPSTVHFSLHPSPLTADMIIWSDRGRNGPYLVVGDGAGVDEVVDAGELPLGHGERDGQQVGQHRHGVGHVHHLGRHRSREESRWGGRCLVSGELGLIRIVRRQSQEMDGHVRCVWCGSRTLS